MKIAFFSSKSYDKEYFVSSNENYNHSIRFIDAKLTCDTVNLIAGESVVCVFVNDNLDRKVMLLLAGLKVKLIALRCAGFNNVDVDAANELGIKVIRVAAYSPHAVAEHTICLMLSLNRKIYRAYNRVRDGNFSLHGLIGFDFAGKTMGIVGTGKIGEIVACITQAMGMKVLAYDPLRSNKCVEMGVEYVSLEELFENANVISLHCPLSSNTKHLIDEAALGMMKKNVMLINTSRGAILDAPAIVQGLKSKKIGYLGMDVYEQESELFFEDLSCEIIQDDIFERLLTFPNVLITSHQGFLTSNALKNIADVTLSNIKNISNNIEVASDVLVSSV